MELIIFGIGTIIIGVVISYLFYYIYRIYLIFASSAISRDIQGLDELPKPTMRDLVKLLSIMKSKREDIKQILDEKIKSEDKYNNPYQ